MPSTAHSSTPLSPTLELAVDLLARRSITPDDAGCQDLMIKRLEAIGFRVERLRFGEVDNFWAERGGSGPLLAFAGHTDVVPKIGRASCRERVWEMVGRGCAR